ncbi:hypothetical protein [Nocardia huaxiensis]|uniref:PknH-like protein n=1 Tax=Nocardia huaxiensis TaxID=2755382 RepID=A0A7D6ZQ45_9NOCA|nr:hypothetical protein [Nocardia huaxiensis]QLY32603.1 hypothetical protein H0264_10405 [Nocardia huaxiensis]UFS93669.1 hypothetical protein LPY97_22970 [Nocardia huaxiensis]
MSLVLLLVATTIAAVVWVTRDRGPDLKYSGQGIANGCDLVDPYVISRWATIPQKPIDSTQNFLGSEPPPDGFWADMPRAQYGCAAVNQGEPVSAEFQTVSDRLAYIDLYLIVGQTDEQAATEFDKLDNQNSSRRGTTTGFGQQAEYLTDGQSPSSASYTLIVLDGNLTFRITISALIKEGAVDAAEVQKICEEQARSVLERMK